MTNKNAEAIAVLLDHIRMLDQLSTPTRTTVTQAYADKNIAEAVKMHAAIHALQASENTDEPSGFLHLSELMRGLEIPPTAAGLEPGQLFLIGQAIARQAKQASESAAAPVAFAEWRTALAEKVDAYIQQQSEEDNEDLDRLYVELKAHILSVPFEVPQPVSAKPLPLTDDASWQFKKFREWADIWGYDTAHTHDGINWLCLNPITADLWNAWKAANSITKEQL